MQPRDLRQVPARRIACVGRCPSAGLPGGPWRGSGERACSSSALKPRGRMCNSSWVQPKDGRRVWNRSLSSRSRSTPGTWRRCSRYRRGSAAAGRAHLRRLDEHLRALRGAYTSLADDARGGETRIAGRRVAARQLPPGLGHGSRCPSRSAGLVLSAAAEDHRAAARRAAARVRVGLRAHSGQRRPSGFAAAVRFINAFQSVTPLTMGELWAWPSALKLALLDHLRSARRRARWGHACRTGWPRIALAAARRVRARPRSDLWPERRSTMGSSRACCTRSRALGPIGL